jgi:protein TonB
MLALVSLGAGKVNATDACVYDVAGAAHAHDGPPPPEPPPTRGPILDFLYNRHFAPCFPIQAAKNQHYGTVWLEFLVGADGTIRDIRVDSSSGYAELDQSALDAAKHWRAWFPAANNRVTYESRVKVHLSFDPPANSTIPRR